MAYYGEKRLFHIDRMIFSFVFSFLTLGCGASCNGIKKVEEKIDQELDSKKEPTLKKEPVSGETAKIKEFELADIGRAFEYRKYDLAAKMLEAHGYEDDYSRFLGILVASAREDWAKVLEIFKENTEFKHVEMSYRAVKVYSQALTEMGRLQEAFKVINDFLEKKKLGNYKKSILTEKKADLLLKLDESEQAIELYKELEKKGSSSTANEALRYKIGIAYIKSGNKNGASNVLAPLALKADSAVVTKQASLALGEAGILPNWSEQEQLLRIEHLISKRLFAEAKRSLELFEKPSKKVQKELNWLEANLLVQSRRNHEGALKALLKVINDGSPYAEQALFSTAVVLSRLNRDEEAIKFYREFARKTINRRRAAQARFTAARLEYYLGKHSASLINLREVLGYENKKKATQLNANDEREAHFIAGMNAFLLKKFKDAQTHFVQASRGTLNEEVLFRNRYWQAASEFEINQEEGIKQLLTLCGQGNDSWYSYMAAIKLNEAGLPYEPCIYLPPVKCHEQDCILEAQIEGLADVLEASVPLEEISSIAQMWATMGLYRDAAKALRTVQGRRTVSIDDRDWIIHFNKLDAPHYAISRASNRLNWNKREEQLWRAASAYPMPYKDLVQSQEEKYSIPQLLIFSIARKESLFDPMAVSYAGAMGMMQMMPATYETNRKKVDLPPLLPGELPGPTESVLAGASELNHLLIRFDGRLPLAIMAYNAGSAAVDRWLERSGDYPMDVFVEKVGFAQTRNYVRRVYQILVRYKILYGGPLPALPRQPGL